MPLHKISIPQNEFVLLTMVGWRNVWSSSFYIANYECDSAQINFWKFIILLIDESNYIWCMINYYNFCKSCSVVLIAHGCFLRYFHFLVSLHDWHLKELA